MARVYSAERRGGEPWVTVCEEDRTFHELKHIVRHADAFEWGYNGSGPLDLALSILTDCVGELFAEPLYKSFAGLYVARQPEAGFVIPEPIVWCWAFSAHAELLRADLSRARGSRRLRLVEPGAVGV